MPLHDVDLNVARRSSKSSAASAKTNGDAARRALPGVPAGTAGVLTMLRTGTETGDIGAFSVNAGSRFPKMPKPQPPAHKGAAPSRTPSQYSRHNSLHGSIHSAKSQQSARSGRSGRERPPMPGEWPYSYRHPVAHDSAAIYNSDARSSLAQESVRSVPLTGHDATDISDRSHSLTHSIRHPGQLSNHRSMASLRSQPEPLAPRPRPPHMSGPRFIHPAHPGYRPASPAWSDSAGGFSGRRPVMRPPPGPRSYTASPAPTSYSYRGLPRHEAVQPTQPRPRPTIEDLRRPFVTSASTQVFPLTSQHHPMARHAASPRFSPRFHEPRLQVRAQMPHSLHTASRSEEDIRPPQRSSDTSPAPFVQQGGFVQRVKNVLEERMTIEQPNWPPRTDTPSPVRDLQQTTTGPTGAVAGQYFAQSPATAGESSYSVLDEVLFENEEVEDYYDGVPADDTEEQAPSSPSVKRLTRDLIKAGIDGMSDIVAMSSDAGDPDRESESGELQYSVHPSRHNSIADPVKNAAGSYESVDTHHNNNDEAGHQHRAEGGVEGDHDQRMPSEPSTQSLTLQMSSSTSPVLSSSTVAEPSSPGPTAVVRRSPSFSSFHVGILHRGERPLSLPLEPSQDIVNGSADNKLSRYTSPPQLHRTRPQSYVENTTTDGEQHAIDLCNLSASPPASTPDSGMHKQEENNAVRSSVDGPTRVTIIPNSLTVTTSFNLFEDTHRHDSGRPESNRQDRSFRPSSLGTVEESDCEPTATSIAGSDSTEVAPPRASIRNSVPQQDTPRRITSSTDGTPPTGKNFRFPLPDLTEDSQEDASTTNLRMLGHRGFGFRGRGGFKDLRRATRPQHQAPAPMIHPQPKSTKSYFARSFQDAHKLPSLNFSRHDLTAKMNIALGFRNSRSLEDLTNTHQSLPEPLDRPLSARANRERYRSFFLADDDEVVELEEPKPSLEDFATTKQTTLDDELMNEIEQLSIPSVRNLSMRLSALFPTIRTSQAVIDLDKVDEALNKTVQEIRGKVADKRDQQAADPGRVSSAAATSSSPMTRQGTITSRGSMAIPSKSRDRPQHLRLNKELPPLPPAAEDTHSSSSTSNGETYESARDSGSSSDDGDSTGESSSIRHTSESANAAYPRKDAAGSTKMKEKEKVVDGEKQVSPEVTPRPWNHAKNYPWSEDSNTADVTLSSDGADKAENVNAQSKHKVKRSHSSPNLRNDGDTIRAIRSMSPGFDAELVPSSSAPEPKNSKEKAKKIGVWRTLSRKRANTSRNGHSEAHIDPHFFHPEEHRQSAVNPGERYPSSGLRGPPGLSIDGDRSYFSDDSDDEERGRPSRRKRFTRLRGKRSLLGMHGSARASPNPSPLDVGRSNQDSMVFVDAPHAPADEAILERPPGGMSKAEFHAKRFVEKLRVFFFKGGEALKHLGRGKRHDRVDNLHTQSAP